MSTLYNDRGEQEGTDMSDYTSEYEVRPRLDRLEIRKMALLLLDNFDGVPYKAYELLASLLKKTNNRDILENVDEYKDKKRHCVFIGEDYAEEELAKIAEAEEASKISEARIEDPVDPDEPIIDDMSINDMKSFMMQEEECYKDVGEE